MLFARPSDGSALPRLSVEGMNKHTIRSGFGLFITQSEVLTQGAQEKIRFASSVRCEDRYVKVAVASGTNVPVKDVCLVASRALRFVLEQAAVDHVSVEIRIVPARVDYHKRFFRFGREPKLTLIAPQMRNLEETLANIADLVAHETFHVSMFVAGDIGLSANEHAAYYYGLCGQLVASGKLQNSALPGFAVDSTDEDVFDSSESAELVRSEVLQISKGEAIASGTAAGEWLLSQCRSFRPSNSRP